MKEKRLHRKLFEQCPWLKDWWDPINALNPEEVSAYSKASVGWRCPECGHRWREMIVKRTRIKKCPVCGARIRMRERERLMKFSDVFPDRLLEFDPAINTGIDITKMTLTDTQMIVWRCTTCGGRWRSSVNDRVVLNTDDTYSLLPCNLCSGRPGSLCYARKYPVAAGKFDEKRNGIYKEEIRSKGRYWWKCSTCGHLFQSSAADMARFRNDKNSSCPKCRWEPKHNGSFGWMYPEKLKEYAVENTLDPFRSNPGSTTKVLWRCTKDSMHVWEASFWDRSHGCYDECPFCRMKSRGQKPLKEFAPELEKFFDRKKNTHPFWAYTLSDGRPISWTCGNGHKYRLSAIQMKKRVHTGGGCPVCAGILMVDGINSLLELHPELMGEWAEIENTLLGISADSLTGGSITKVYWRCRKCNGIYYMSPKRKQGYFERGQEACPACKGVKRNRIHYF